MYPGAHILSQEIRNGRPRATIQVGALPRVRFRPPIATVAMPRYAVLIDAGFLRRKLGSREHPMDAERAAVFIERLGAHQRLASLTLHRIYYYDAPPLAEAITKPLSGGRINSFWSQGIATSCRR